MGDLRNKKVILESLITDTPLKRINALEATQAPSTWKRVMSMKVNDTRHQGVANNLTRDEIATIAATAEYFGANTQMIMFDLAIARYRIFDWLAMCVQGRMDKTPTKVLVNAFLKANGNIDKFIQDLRETDYDVRTEWESIILESFKVDRKALEAVGTVEESEALNDVIESGPFVTDSYAEGKEPEAAEEILANLNETTEMSDKNKRGAIRKLVEDDLKDIIQEDPMLSEVEQGNRLDKNLYIDLKEGYLQFKYSKDDTRTNEERVRDASQRIADTLDLRILDVFPRKATKNHDVQQGNAHIVVPVWCADLQQDLNKPYAGLEGTEGFAFEIQLSASKSILAVAIRYTGKAI